MKHHPDFRPLRADRVRINRRIGAAAFALGVVLSTGSAAVASPLPDPERDTATLHITKQSTPAAATRDDGLPNPTATNPPIEGVEFSFARVLSYQPDDAAAPTPIDLTTASGWAAAGALAKVHNADVDHATSLPTGVVLADEPATCTTSAVGKCDQTLPLGLYWVTETGTPDGITPANPFLVTLPLTNPDGTGWLYDVYVYPKNLTVDVMVKITADVIRDDGYSADIKLTAKVDHGPTSADDAHGVIAHMSVQDENGRELKPEEFVVRKEDAKVSVNGSNDKDKLKNDIYIASVHFPIGDLALPDDVTYEFIGTIQCPWSGKLYFPIYVEAVLDSVAENNNDKDWVEVTEVCSGTSNPPPSTTPSAGTTSPTTSVAAPAPTGPGQPTRPAPLAAPIAQSPARSLLNRTGVPIALLAIAVGLFAASHATRRRRQRRAG